MMSSRGERGWKTVLLRCIASLVLIVRLPDARAQGGESAYEIVQKTDYATAFKSADTNTPLLVMDWFSHSHSDEYCRVSQLGRVSSARHVVNWAIQGGHWADLNRTNLELLVATMNELPPPPALTPPQERWLIIQGIRSNQWFKSIYDRANIPVLVERLYEITGARLTWYIPQVRGSQKARVESGSFACVARDVAVAVVIDYDLLQVLDMTGSAYSLTPRLGSTPYLFSPGLGQSVVISPDGRTVVLATHHHVHAVEWKTDKELWKLGRLGKRGMRYNNRLAIGGDRGQFLFAEGAHTIERWDLATGQKLATLATNQAVVKNLEASRDGSTLLAGFDDDFGLGTRATAFAIWESGNDAPVRRFVERNVSGVGISPNGRQIAVCLSGRKKLVIWDWRTQQRTEVPLRTSDAESDVCAMYWTPDGKRLAAYVAMGGPSVLVLIYDTTTWKPVAKWNCTPSSGYAGDSSVFAFTKDAVLLHMRAGQMDMLDVASLK